MIILIIFYYLLKGKYFFLTIVNQYILFYWID